MLPLLASHPSSPLRNQALSNCRDMWEAHSVFVKFRATEIEKRGGRLRLTHSMTEALMEGFNQKRGPQNQRAETG